MRSYVQKSERANNLRDLEEVAVLKVATDSWRDVNKKVHFRIKVGGRSDRGGHFDFRLADRAPLRCYR